MAKNSIVGDKKWVKARLVFWVRLRTLSIDSTSLCLICRVCHARFEAHTFSLDSVTEHIDPQALCSIESGIERHSGGGSRYKNTCAGVENSNAKNQRARTHGELHAGGNLSFN